MLFTKSEIEDKRSKIANRRKIITILLYVILVPILIFNIFMISQTIIKPQNTPALFGNKFFIIISGSMQPNIKIGDMVLVKDVEESDIKVNDIISFKKGESVITHRVVEVAFGEDGKKEYITKGDYNNAKDMGSVKYSEIEGKVEKKIPFIGKIALKIQKKTSIVVVISIMIVFLLFRLKNERKMEIRNAKRVAYENKV